MINENIIGIIMQITNFIRQICFDKRLIVLIVIQLRFHRCPYLVLKKSNDYRLFKLSISPTYVINLTAITPDTPSDLKKPTVIDSIPEGLRFVLKP